jgi:hypothetical protein
MFTFIIHTTIEVGDITLHGVELVWQRQQHAQFLCQIPLANKRVHYFRHENRDSLESVTATALLIFMRDNMIVFKQLASILLSVFYNWPCQAQHSHLNAANLRKCGLLSSHDLCDDIVCFQVSEQRRRP